MRRIFYNIKTLSKVILRSEGVKSSSVRFYKRKGQRYGFLHLLKAKEDLWMNWITRRKQIMTFKDIREKFGDNCRFDDNLTPYTNPYIILNFVNGEQNRMTFETSEEAVEFYENLKKTLGPDFLIETD